MLQPTWFALTGSPHRAWGPGTALAPTSCLDFTVATMGSVCKASCTRPHDVAGKVSDRLLAELAQDTKRIAERTVEWQTRTEEHGLQAIRREVKAMRRLHARSTTSFSRVSTASAEPLNAHIGCMVDVKINLSLNLAILVAKTGVRTSFIFVCVCVCVSLRRMVDFVALECITHGRCLRALVRAMGPHPIGLRAVARLLKRYVPARMHHWLQHSQLEAEANDVVDTVMASQRHQPDGDDRDLCERVDEGAPSREHFCIGAQKHDDDRREHDDEQGHDDMPNHAGQRRADRLEGVCRPLGGRPDEQPANGPGDLATPTWIISSHLTARSSSTRPPASPS